MIYVFYYTFFLLSIFLVTYLCFPFAIFNFCSILDLILHVCFLIVFLIFNMTWLKMLSFWLSLVLLWMNSLGLENHSFESNLFSFILLFKFFVFVCVLFILQWNLITNWTEALKCIYMRLQIYLPPCSSNAAFKLSFQIFFL